MRQIMTAAAAVLVLAGCGGEGSAQPPTTPPTTSTLATVLPAAPTVCAQLTAAARGDTTLNFNAVAASVVRDHVGAYFDATGVDPIPDETLVGLENDVALAVESGCPDVADDFASYRDEFGVGAN